MSRFPLALSFILFATSAFAIGELPTVNPGRTVSALELYGMPPQPMVEKKQEAQEVKVAARGQRSFSNELLVPNKPSGDLWSNNGEAPLRMPAKDEYLTLKYDFVLPEESLDEPEPAYFAATRTGTRAVPAQKARYSGGNVTMRETKEEEPKSLPKRVVAEPVSTRVPAPSAKPVPSTIKSPANMRPAQKAQASYDEDEEFAYLDDVPLSKLSPSQLKKAFKKTFISENKHLSTYQIDDGFDERSFSESSIGFDSSRDLSEQAGVRPLEIKINFYDEDSSLSRDTYNLLTEYAGIVASNPKRAVQISISERTTRSYDGRKLAARRLAIIEQILKDSGIIDRRIIPVLSQRNDDAFLLRVISNDTFQVLSEKKRDMFGDTTSSKTSRSMSW